MALDDRQTYYDVLEIMPDASPQEIREAYVRLKSAYTKDSPAMYSLLTRDDTDRLLRDIENAYQILSSPEKRKEYDRHHGLIIESPQNHEPLSPPRAPRVQTQSQQWDIFDAPPTDFQPRSPIPSKISAHQESIDSTLVRMESMDSVDPELEDQIQKELEWKGEFLRRVRESRKLSIEELSDFTKISKRYLKAIEEDDFKALPAAVYLRGFMIQISKRLKIPGETVAAAYLARYRQACKTQD